MLRLFYKSKPFARTDFMRARRHADEVTIRTDPDRPGVNT
jgi:hypothetical protein